MHPYDYPSNHFIDPSTVVPRHCVAQYWILKSFITNPSTETQMFPAYTL